MQFSGPRTAGAVLPYRGSGSVLIFASMVRIAGTRHPHEISLLSAALVHEQAFMTEGWGTMEHAVSKANSS